MGALNEAERWQAVAAHRPMLERIARARTVSVEDAEDAVQEAMLRVATFADLDVKRLEALLVAVTTRLCVDTHRRRQRDLVVVQRAGWHDVAEPAPDEQVCDQALGRWAMGQLDGLAARERDVLVSRASGATHAETVRALSLTHKAGEAAFTRARAKMQRAIAAALGLAGLLGLRSRRLAASASPLAVTAVAVSTAAMLFAVPLLNGDAGPSAGAAPASSGPARDEVARVRSAPPRPTTPRSELTRADRRAVATPSKREVARTTPARMGPVTYSGAGVGWENTEESLDQTLRRCLDKGIGVSPSYVGCHR